jgi:hypothetical protein
MDILSLQKKNIALAGGPGYHGDKYGAVPMGVGGDGSEARADRINDVVKRVKANGPVTNKWGGKDYPIDIGDYGQFLSALQTISWVLRDGGYEIQYLTRNGLQYQSDTYYSYPNLFDVKSGKIVAMVASGKDGRYYRFSRDDKNLKIRRFDSLTRAIAPMRDGGEVGGKDLSASLVKEVVRVMKSQSRLDPKDGESLRRFGRIVQSKALKPVGAGMLKSQLKIQFTKV